MIDPLWLFLAAVVLLVCAAVLWWAEKPAVPTGVFLKSSDDLTDEWVRGAAAGMAPKDVRKAIIDDREFYLANVGNTPVLAVRKATQSDVVLDFRTFESETDLLPVQHVAGFELYSNDPDVAKRALDDRMEIALQALDVDAVWAESEWVLAQFKDKDPAEITAALGLFADAAAVLPPRSPKPLVQLDPTRPMVAPRETAVVEPEDPAKLVLLEPVRKPKRSVPTALGVVEPRPVGVDDIDAIAEGPAQLPESDGTRIIRPDDRPTIF
ncbi:type III secretion system chaperone family protein [Corynebacterium epidermidicanis]|uniref:Uncharacterized protein n=1 Tax=Corynebacterium epidermidicanis TaxID=1050174 RepID=A0A0G3GTQ3_9CORY|nr:hypothetical protein [Corynebacterium epidermidicanis]AKK02197.1 hypothetical protein CEPID_01560 [Corynebacterium epidermidicanis]